APAPTQCTYVATEHHKACGEGWFHLNLKRAQLFNCAANSTTCRDFVEKVTHFQHESITGHGNTVSQCSNSSTWPSRYQDVGVCL
ncbi:hypothetical protein GOODEAATRI_003447, partial [Goodea atripinnis]